MYVYLLLFLCQDIGTISGNGAPYYGFMVMLAESFALDMKRKITLAELNALSTGNMGEHLGIEFTETGEDYLCGKMPVDHRTRQPMGLLHGGASAAFAETLGSVGSLMLVNPETHAVVGVEINASHLRKATEGYVYGRASLISRSRKLHVWDIRITNEKQEMVCISRLTVMVLERQT